MQQNHKKRHSIFSDDEGTSEKTTKMLATLKESHEEDLQAREILEQTVLEEAEENQAGFFEVDDHEEKADNEQKREEQKNIKKRISFNQ